MSSELVHISQQPTSVQQGGLGVDFSSRLFRLKPATININQASTTASGALPGHLRISETGDQYKTMTVALLVMPVEERSFYVGEVGQLNRTPENLMCFSRDMVQPHADAKVPQSMRCSNCKNANWEKWRQSKKKEDIPGCDAYFKVLLIDQVYKTPLQMYIRSKSKGPFEDGMQNLAREFAKLKSTGINPNIFDISFQLSTKQITSGKFVSYVLALSDFKAIAPEDREKFGDIYLQYVNRNNRSEEDAAADQLEETSQSIDAAVSNTIDAEFTDTISL